MPESGREELIILVRTKTLPASNTDGDDDTAPDG